MRTLHIPEVHFRMKLRSWYATMWYTLLEDTPLCDTPDDIQIVYHTCNSKKYKHGDLTYKQQTSSFSIEPNTVEFALSGCLGLPVHILFQVPTLWVFLFCFVLFCFVFFVFVFILFVCFVLFLFCFVFVCFVLFLFVCFVFYFVFCLFVYLFVSALFFSCKVQKNVVWFHWWLKIIRKYLLISFQQI